MPPHHDPIAAPDRIGTAPLRPPQFASPVTLGLLPLSLLSSLSEFDDLAALILLAVGLVFVACWWSIRMQRLAAEQLAASEARLRRHYDHCPLPTLTWQRIGADLVLIDHNGAQEAMTGGRMEMMRGRAMREIHRDRPDLIADHERCLTEQTTFRREFSYRIQSTGEDRHLATTYVFVPPDLVVAYAEDLTERHAHEAALRASQERLTYQAFHDALTDLPNRALFLDRLEHALARARRDEQPCAVLFFDLDRFKQVNDTLGHAVGDALLDAVADRLRECLREEDTLARLGGDEFALLLEAVVDLGEVVRVAERLLAALDAPFTVASRELIVTASIGIALSTGPEDSALDLLRFADVALYRAKDGGRARYEAFYPGMNAGALARMELEHDLRLALAGDEIQVYYQPKVDLATGRVAALEALVRWNHPTRGLISPGEFVTLAEETGLIVPLGRYVLAEACRLLGEWRASHPGPLSLELAVNLSARQFRHLDLVSDVAAILAATQIPPERLILEITETAAMEKPASTIATLRELKALGVRLALDDFGTGHSSLEYLQRLPLDMLKIDRSFFADTAQNRAIVGAVTDLAHGLGLVVTAEGLETVDQVAWACAAGCDRGQGYYFDRPLAPAELGTLYANGLAYTMPTPAVALPA